MTEAHNLIIQVADIQGHCPVYQCGDRFFIRKGYLLSSDRSLCMHALQAIAPYYVSLSRGITPVELGLSGPDGAAYVQCLDAHRYTGGGTVTFRISRDPQ